MVCGFWFWYDDGVGVFLDLLCDFGIVVLVDLVGVCGGS